MRPFRHLLPAAASLALAVAAPAESLWTASGSDRGMFADHRASQTGDILTIVVSESVAASNNQSKKLTRDSSLADAVTSFLYPTTGLHNGQVPNINLAGSASSSGTGGVSNNQSLSSRAAVLVTDVLPNRNLVIEGVRVVTFSGETQYVVLHGLVRPDDIAPDNTILSSNIADARVEFLSEGSLTDAQKRGWLTKLYEKLRPF
jgi:flagellar L-ring protein precursor FlgH